jgi:ZIP family zinc transporter
MLPAEQRRWWQTRFAMNSTLGLALLLSTLAGASTMLGSAVTVFFCKPGPRFMSLMMGFSAGVMILVSFGELLQDAVKEIGFASAYIAFFAGMGFMFLIDILIPHIHVAERQDADGGAASRSTPVTPTRGRHGHRHGARVAAVPESRLLRTGVLVALGIGIHNLPEGVTTFVGTMRDPALGLVIAVAIALHNIPEGVAVSAPVFAATASRRRALAWSALSAVAEPVGAILAASILLPFLDASLLGTVLAAVAGIMIFISLDELIPVARSFCEEHYSILGVMAGMIVMALSLGLLRD